MSLRLHRLLAVAIAVLASSACLGQTPISSLPGASPLNGPELVPIVQSNRTVQTTLQGIKNFTLAGPIPPGFIPLPTDSTLGGVKSSTAPANQFATGISTAGTVTYAQPAFPNISGFLACSQAPAFTGDVATAAGSCAATVARINGVALGSTTPTAGNVLLGSGTALVSTPVTGDGTLNGSGLLTISKTGGVSFGTAATQNIGTSGALVPVLNAANFWTAQQVHGATSNLPWNYGQYENLNALGVFYGNDVVNGSAAVAAFSRVHTTSSSIAGTFFSFCDGTAANSNAIAACWGIYDDTRVFPGSTGFGQGAEFEIANLTGSPGVAFDPYNFTPGSITYALALGSGSQCGTSSCPDQTGVDRTPLTASAALRILNNTASFINGIVFDATSLSGTDGSNASTGFGVAVLMARNQLLQWDASDSIGRALFGSTATTSSSLSSLVYTNTGWQILNGGPGSPAVFAFNTNTISDPFFSITSIANARQVNFGLTDGFNAVINVSAGSDIFLQNNSSTTATFAASLVTFAVPLNAAATPTGTPASSLCLDSAGNVIKKTTAGSCI